MTIERKPASKFIEDNEGFRKKVYKDSVGVETIGHGITLRTLRAEGILKGNVFTRGKLKGKNIRKISVTKKQGRVLKNSLGVMKDANTLIDSVKQPLDNSQKEVIKDYTFSRGMGNAKRVTDEINKTGISGGADLMRREAAEVFIKRSKQGKDIRGWVNRHKRGANILEGGDGKVEEVPRVNKPIGRDLLRLEEQIPKGSSINAEETFGRQPASIQHDPELSYFEELPDPIQEQQYNVYNPLEDIEFLEN